MKGTKRKGRSFVVLVIALLVSYGAGFLGSIFTAQEVTGTWYASVRPSLTPPNWVFPIVWNILFFLIAVSIWMAWRGSTRPKERKMIVLIYGLNLLANMIWSALYFKMHNPLLAFIDLLLIAFTILLAMVFSWRIDRRASWILLPYLIWVVFAGVLNVLSI